MIISIDSLNKLKEEAIKNYSKKYNEDYPIDKLKILDILLGKFIQDNPNIELEKNCIKVNLSSKNLKYILLFKNNNLQVTMVTPSGEFNIYNIKLK